LPTARQLFGDTQADLAAMHEGIQISVIRARGRLLIRNRRPGVIDQMPVAAESFQVHASAIADPRWADQDPIQKTQISKITMTMIAMTVPLI
jgi:hypothetical protein